MEGEGEQGIPISGDSGTGGAEDDEDEKFQLYGPAAAVHPHTAAQSQWLAAKLDEETHNFLAFLAAEVQAKKDAGGTTVVGDDQLAGGAEAGNVEAQGLTTISFETLLPPDRHSSVVAAQGLLHVLALATKGLIIVRQEVAFGGIELGLSTG